MKSFSWSEVDAVLFDLDGVVTPTAVMHEQAWAKLFEAYEYTEDDYLQYIDGKPRYEGVASFLASRDIELPFGERSDEAGDSSIVALGSRKNEIFLELLESEGIEPYAGSVALCDYLDEQNVKMAVVSSSRNAQFVLRAAKMNDRFLFVVDGLTAEAENIPGKPKPDTYLHAATKIGADPSRVMVIEDATAGVKSGSAGGFGIVVGVDRGAGRDVLLSSGADLVVDDLAELIEHDPKVGADNV